METVSTGYGYLLYSVQLKNYHRENKLKVVEASDRLHIFTDGQLQAIQYQETLGEELLIQGTPDKETIELDVLVENLGRVNYGFKLNGPTQAKGIRGASCKIFISTKAIVITHWRFPQSSYKPSIIKQEKSDTPPFIKRPSRWQR